MKPLYTTEKVLEMVKLLDRCETCLTHLTGPNKNDIVFHGEALFLLDTIRMFLKGPNKENGLGRCMKAGHRSACLTHKPGE